MTYWMMPEDERQMEQEAWDARWRHEMMGGWCFGVVASARNPGGKLHLLPCAQEEGHEGECAALNKAFWDHNCQASGCNDPALVERYSKGIS